MTRAHVLICWVVLNLWWLGVVCVCAWAGQPAEAPPLGLSTPCRIVRVIDGDTVEVAIEVRLDVRLLDCWAPETSTPQGVIAKRWLEDYVGRSKPATLYIPAAKTPADILAATSMGRVLGHLYTSKTRTLSQTVVAAGHAKPQKP